MECPRNAIPKFNFIVLPLPSSHEAMKADEFINQFLLSQTESETLAMNCSRFIIHFAAKFNFYVSPFPEMYANTYV